eukprot:gnl/MRDRNA2_/MRDRNA2_77173_c0_seq1.p1 gnl/MRDRNA2_/MRDRNA2_77173_c0~~gnl/MRDRNA2_/MRDRNA2_77173_c0_seq1.p1  ORF type:complete len:898 (+),score=172.77 gnl/MRDRNA2_/MRDRNA2_77173_c0_seq1:102-2795(+)
MGNGCFKGSSVGERSKSETIPEPMSPLGGDSCEPESFSCTEDKEVFSGKANVASIIQASAQPKNHDGEKLGALLNALAQNNPQDACDALVAWWLKQATKSRTNMLILVQRILGHALEAKVAAAEKAISRQGSGTVEADFERICSFCKEELTLGRSVHKGVLAGVLFLSRASVEDKVSGDENRDLYLVSALDQLILLFRHSLLTHIGSTAKNFQIWRELVTETMLPPVHAHLSILSCSAKAVMINLLLVPDGVPPAGLIINRSHTLIDITKDLPSKSACVISPYFESASGTKVVQGRRVEGGEGHGPRKEFFIAVSANSLKLMFDFHRGTGDHWFNAYANDLSDDKRRCFQNFGKLLALALANRCKISFTLPVMFFTLLLRRDDFVPSLEDIQGFDSALHASLKKCLKMKDADFKALKDTEDLPSTMSRADYVSDQIRSLMTPEALKETRSGFWELVSGASLQGFSAWDIRQALCPVEKQTGNINIRKIFTVVVEEEMADVQVFADTFWSVVDGLTPAEKQRFLVFVTGVEMPPEPGTERLIIQLPFSAFSKDEHIEMLSKLPQAHTCSNTIELPNYYESLVESGKFGEDPSQKVIATELKKILGEKLRLAINETTGYELDATETDNAPAVQGYAAGGQPIFPHSGSAEVRQAVAPKLGTRPAETEGKFSSRSMITSDISQSPPWESVKQFKTSDSSQGASSPSTDIPDRNTTSSNGNRSNSVSPGPAQGIDDFLKDLDDVMQPLEMLPGTQLKSSAPAQSLTSQSGFSGQPMNSAGARSMTVTSTISNVGSQSPKGHLMPGTPQGRAMQTTITGQPSMYSPALPQQGGVMGVHAKMQRELPPVVKSRFPQAHFVPASGSPFTNPAPRSPAGVAGQNLLHMALVGSSTASNNTGGQNE